MPTAAITSTITKIEEIFSTKLKSWSKSGSLQVTSTHVVIELASNSPMLWSQDMKETIVELKRAGLIDSRFEADPFEIQKSCLGNIGALRLEIPLTYITQSRILPKLIFGDIHSDPITEKILIKLMPKLRQLGYSCYIAEMQEDSSLDEALRLIDAASHAFNEYLSKFKALGLDLYKRADQIKFCAEHSADPLQTLTSIKASILIYPSLATQKEFLLSLRKNNIEYRASDLELPLDLYVEKIAERDIALSKAYIAERGLVFGEVGKKHIPGIQQNLIEELGKEKAASEFLFFHVFSKEEQDEPTELPAIDDLTAVMLRGFGQPTVAPADPLDNLPLGIIKFDADKIDEDEIVNHILKAIQGMETLPSNEVRNSPFSAATSAATVYSLENKTNTESKSPSPAVVFTQPSDASSGNILSLTNNSLTTTNSPLSGASLNLFKNESPEHSTSTLRAWIPSFFNRFLSTPELSNEDIAFRNRFLNHYSPGCFGGHWNYFRRNAITQQNVTQYAASHPNSATDNALIDMGIKK